MWRSEAVFFNRRDTEKNQEKLFFATLRFNNSNRREHTEQKSVIKEFTIEHTL